MNTNTNSVACAIHVLLPAGVWLLFMSGAVAQTSSVFVDGFKYSDPKFETSIQIDLTDVPGATGVDAVSANGTVRTLTPFYGAQFTATFGPYPDLASFLAATSGT